LLILLQFTTFTHFGQAVVLQSNVAHLAKQIKPTKHGRFGEIEIGLQFFPPVFPPSMGGETNGILSIL
jgi:hypothetical protein